jgi:hypothetical protein
MTDDFRAKAAALRNAAADPETDLRLIWLMIETAADLEAAAESMDAERMLATINGVVGS